MSGQPHSAVDAESLTRAVSGQSFSNYPAIIHGFMARGIPEDQIIPRENVFTYNAWRAFYDVAQGLERGTRVNKERTRPGSRLAVHTCRECGSPLPMHNQGCSLTGFIRLRAEWPRANEYDKANGWTLDPAFLTHVKKVIGKLPHCANQEKPYVQEEEIEVVLLAAEQFAKYLEPK